MSLESTRLGNRSRLQADGEVEHGHLELRRLPGFDGAAARRTHRARSESNLGLASPIFFARFHLATCLDLFIFPGYRNSLTSGNSEAFPGIRKKN